MKHKKPFWKTVLHFLVLCAVTFIVIFPLVITLFTSLKPPNEVITATPTLLPHDFTLENYIKLFKVRNFPQYMLNSLVVASFTAVLSLLISSLGACAIVWMKFPGKRVVINTVLAAYMFPQILLIIPLFIMCYCLNLIDTKFSLVLAYLSFSLPFSVWMLKTFFESIPKELMEAALMDGCSYWQALTKIILPISLSSITTVLIFSFVLGWSEYLFAVNLITTDANRTIAVGLQKIG
ncbi:MAG: carbohydrate ABC transporter permease, partial [Clostridia bacterium]|nr:carbohydrate ABC transporter permease [Clostridia bacterium]